MASLVGPDFVALQVRDLGASARFYRETVGLPTAPGGPPNAVVFATEPIPFAVREPLVDLDAVDRLGWGVALWFGCDDPDALHARLVAAGVTIAQEPIDGAFGRQFAFVDPDGYRITVHGAARAR
jgi:predicted enzyme related to lactoylglutathione lyase